MFFKKGFLENFAIFKGKDLCWSDFLVKLLDFKLKLHTGIFLWIPFFKTPPVAGSALTYDLNGLKSRDRHLLFFLNSFSMRCLSFSFSFICNSMPYSGCSALHGFNPDQEKKTEILSQLINLKLIFVIRPIEKSILAINDINGLSKIANLLEIKRSGTCRSSSAAAEVLLLKWCSQNMLIRA